jgi:hypothetical protein
MSTSEYEEGVAGTEKGRKDDPLKEYREKEAMTPAKEKAHEPTAVKRDTSEIDEDVAKSSEESREKLRRSGMTKGTDKA